MYMIDLPGSRIYLRPVECEDAFTVVKWRNTADSRSAFFDRRVVTPDTHADFVMNRSKHDLVWMAFGANEVPIGMTSVTNHDVKHYIGEYGRTYIDELYRGQGYAKEIEFLMLWAAFEWLNVDRLWLDAYADNEPIVNLHYATGWSAAGIDVIGHTDPHGQVLHMEYSRDAWKQYGRDKYVADFDVTLPGWVE